MGVSRHLVLSLLAVALKAAISHPQYFLDGYANGCTDHPTSALGRHKAPAPDKTTTFKITTAAGAASAAVCPGTAYKVSVDYGANTRETYITASTGSFATAPKKECPGATVGSERTSVFTDTLTLPCTATGNLKLVVTSSGRSSDAFHDASTTVPISPVSKCPGSKCPGAPAAAAAAAVAPKAAAAATPAATPAPITAAAAASGAAQPVAAAAPAAATKAGAAAAGIAAAAAAQPADAAAAAAMTKGGTAGKACPKSSYGYSCAVPLSQGGQLHFTMGGDAPPANPCTATTVDSNRLAAADITGGAQPVHLLLDSPAAGYAGLAFPVTAGRMSPADAVIGYVDPATGKPTVSAYGLTDYAVDPSNSNFNSRGWAKNMGVARPAGAPQRTLLCFSRLTDAPQAQFLKQLNGQAVNLNWVGHDSIDFDHHTLTGSVNNLNLADGQAQVTQGNDVASSRIVTAHGALMLLAFVVFMPLGGLTARHKWLFGDKEKGGLSAAWFFLHRGVQLLAVLLALAGFIMAVVAFKVSWSLDAPTPHSLYNPHRFIGVVVMGLVLMQALTGFLRPKMGARNRQPWRFGHLSLGWLSMALGLVVVFLGVVLMHDLKSRPWVDWLLPVVLLLVLLLLAGVVGEVLKTRLESRGCYMPHTHKFGDSLALTGDDVLKPKAAQAAPAGTRNGTTGSTPFESSAADNGFANGNAGKAQLLTGQPSV